MALCKNRISLIWVTQISRTMDYDRSLWCVEVSDQKTVAVSKQIAILRTLYQVKRVIVQSTIFDKIFSKLTLLSTRNSTFCRKIYFYIRTRVISPNCKKEQININSNKLLKTKVENVNKLRFFFFKIKYLKI